MTFLRRVLDAPSYGFEKDGKLYVPSKREILSEFFGRLNVFRDRKNWLPFFGWLMSLSLAVPLGVFLFRYFSWPLAVAGFLYSMVVLGSHGTFWLHRYGTHRAFRFKNRWIRGLCRNLVLRIIPEEIYVVSHHVHHQFPEKPGDPYNSLAGWLYCFLADVNHQTINKNFSEGDYRQVTKLLDHTGVRPNTYSQYRKWGSVCHPARTVFHYLANWGFWYGVFYWAGGHALATALFGSAGVWAMGVRTFNYEGHARGKLKHRDGIDFHRRDLSINQLWPGYVSGEWHNNHHLYPNGARAGFLPYQLDLPWLFIRGLEKLGAVEGVKDYRDDFLKNHYLPYRNAQNAAALAPSPGLKTEVEPTAAARDLDTGSSTMNH